MSNAYRCDRCGVIEEGYINASVLGEVLYDSDFCEECTTSLQAVVEDWMESGRDE